MPCLAMPYRREEREHVAGGEHVEAVLPTLAAARAHHRKGLAAARLPVRETRRAACSSVREIRAHA